MPVGWYAAKGHIRHFESFNWLRNILGVFPEVKVDYELVCALFYRHWENSDKNLVSGRASVKFYLLIFL